jgi:hypothetical protein
MAQTIDEFGDKIALALGEDYNDYDTKEVFQEYIIEGIEFIMSDKSWPFGRFVQSFVSSIGADSYSADTNTADIRVVFDVTNNRVLDNIDQDTIQLRNFDIDSTGTPSHWYWKQATSGVFIIGLWPIPVAEVTYNLYGDKHPENLTGASTIPFPPSANTALRHYVYALYKEGIGDYTGAQLSKLRFQTAYTSLQKRYQSPVSRVRKFRARDIPGRVHAWLQFPDTITGPGP